MPSGDDACRVARTFFTHRLTKDVKLFEAELKSKSDASIEQLKNSLQLASIEHQIKFSNLHDKRAEIIAEAYKLLVEANWACESYVSPMTWAGELSKDEKAKVAFSSMNDFIRYFNTHLIYLPSDVCVLLDNLVNDIKKPLISFNVWQNMDGDENLADKHKAWVAAWDVFKKDIPPTKKKLEDEFRKILGDSIR